MRNLKSFVAGLSLATALVMSGSAFAQKTASGSSNGLSWSAQSTLIGQTSTATLAAGGNPIYQPTVSQQRGVVNLLMNTSAGGFVCTGTLLSDRRSILTAAHCVSDGAGTANPISTTAFFNNTGDGDVITRLGGAGTAAVSVSNYIVNAGYTGQVIDQNDIAILTLANAAPSWAVSYDVDYSGNLGGNEFTVAGYGGRSDVGGALGVNLGATRLRQGNNIFDFALGDADFGGFWNGFFGTADVTNSWLSDFDNGRAANDASCILATDAVNGFGIPNTGKYCQTGVGALEVGVAGGDSGGPQFINGKLVSVTSYGLSFGGTFGDFRPGLNSSWGEFSGYVPTYIHERFIRGAMVPEPGTWAMLIFGFGLIGGAARRRNGSTKSVIA